MSTSKWPCYPRFAEGLPAIGGVPASSEPVYVQIIQFHDGDVMLRISMFDWDHAASDWQVEVSTNVLGQTMSGRRFSATHPDLRTCVLKALAAYAENLQRAQDRLLLCAGRFVLKQHAKKESTP